MSELKHTPRPWEAAKYPEGHYGIFERNYPFQIAEVLNRKCSDEMVEANARLIAAAPCMLSVIESLLSLWYKTGGTDDAYEVIEAEALLDAIAGKETS
jgi:hypothetical protein